MNNTASNPKCIPELRFPGFEGEWIQKSMGEICNGIMYGMNSAAISFDGENKYLRITDIDEETREFRPNPLSSPEGDIEDKYILKKGDIVFARTGASVGKSYLYRESDGKLLFAGFLIKFTVKNSNSYFIYSHTLTSSFKKWVQLMSMRSGQPGINAEEYKLLKLFLPSIPEQTKIASFLTAVDNKIHQLTRKKELMEQYKKGVMQKIFNREIRLRDEEGKEYPEWEKTRLGKLTQLFSNRNPKLIEATIYSVTNSNGFVPQNEHFDREVAGKDLSNYKIIERGDFAYNPARINVGSIAYFTEGIGVISSLYVCFRTNKELMDKFLIYFLQLESTKFQINNLGEGGVRIYLWYDLFSLIKCDLPCIKEQQKIASFLSSIDQKITLVSQQLEKMQTWKKGLLQNMFC